MPDIPIRVTGSGLETFDRIQNGFKKVQGAAAGAAAASRMPIRAPAGGFMPADFFPGVRMGNFGSGFTPAGWGGHNQRTDGHGGGAHGGRHGGLMGSLHGISRGVGGVAGEAAHRIAGIGALGMMGGPLGIGLAAAGLALNAFAAAMERAAKKTGDVFDRNQKIWDIKREADIARGNMGLEAAGQGNGLRQLANQGLLDAFKAARAKGFDGSAESFAGLGGNQSRLQAVLTAHMLGAGTEEAAGMAKLLGSNANGTLAGRQIASQILGRRISDREFQRAQSIQASGITGQLNKVEALQGQTANVKLGYLSDGSAVSAAQRGLSQALDPSALPLQEMKRASLELQMKLNAQAESAGATAESLKAFMRTMGMGEGSYGQKRNDEKEAFDASNLSSP